MAFLNALFVFVAYLYFIVGVHAESSFINPPEIGNTTADPSTNPVYKVGDILKIEWETTDDVVTLIINQDSSSLTQIDYLPNSIALTQSPYNWKITIDGSDTGSTFDLLTDNKFNFMLFPSGQTSPSATSQYFNITNSTVDQYGVLISSSSSSTSTSSSTLSTATLPSSAFTSASASLDAQTTNSASTSTAAPSNSGLSDTTKVGLGVGLGLGGLMFISIGFVIWFIRRRRAGQETKHEPVPVEDNETQFKYAQDNWQPPSELHATAPATRPVSELHATPSPNIRPSELPG